MRVVSYKKLAGMGPGKERKQGTVADLLLDIPYFVFADVLPSFEALNALLAKGIEDAGMSGGVEWKPFQITPDEYREAIEELRTNPRMTKLRSEEDAG
jgi:hypothetical protein